MKTKQDSTSSSTAATLSDIQKAQMLLDIAIGKQREADEAREKAEAAFRKLELPMPLFDRLDNEREGR